MSATLVQPNLQTTTVDGTSSGYLTFEDATGYVQGARAWLRDQAGANPVEVFMTSVDVITGRVGAVLVSELPENYGRSNVSAYLRGSTLNQWSPQLSNQSRPEVFITITPGSVTLVGGATQTFTATVTGGIAQSVTWSAVLGTITSAGVYTAPGGAYSDTVIATSTQYPWIRAYAHVSITLLLSILPHGPTPDQVATGSLTTVGGVAVTCTRALSAYCLGNDNLIHLLSSNQIRVEPGLGLLVEGPSANAVTQSNNFSHADWSGGAGLSFTQDVTGPDGIASSAWTVNTGTSSAGHFLQHNSTTGVAFNTTSVYVKAGTGANFISLRIASSNTNWAIFDVRTGAVVQTNGTVTTFSQALANGWFRIATFTGGAADAFLQYFIGETQAQAVPSANYTGTGKTCLIFGVQNEQSIGFPTSYIPTTTLQVTRPAETINVANPLPATPAHIRASMKLKVLGGATGWQNSPNGFRTFITAGVTGTNPDEWISYSAVNSNTVQAQVTDHTAGQVTVTRSATLNNSDTHTVIMLYTPTGALQESVDGDAFSGTPVGTATVSAVKTPLILGSGNGTNHVYGWLTDIIVHNV